MTAISCSLLCAQPCVGNPQGGCEFPSVVPTLQMRKPRLKIRDGTKAVTDRPFSPSPLRLQSLQLSTLPPCGRFVIYDSKVGTYTSGDSNPLNKSFLINCVNAYDINNATKIDAAPCPLEVLGTVRVANSAGDREQHSLTLKGHKHDKCYGSGSFFSAVPSALFLHPHRLRAVGGLPRLNFHFSLSKGSLWLTQFWPCLSICDHL